MKKQLFFYLNVAQFMSPKRVYSFIFSRKPCFIFILIINLCLSGHINTLMCCNNRIYVLQFKINVYGLLHFYCTKCMVPKHNIIM